MIPERVNEIQEEFASLFQEMIDHIEGLKTPLILKMCAKNEIESTATIVSVMLEKFRRNV